MVMPKLTYPVAGVALAVLAALAKAALDGNATATNVLALIILLTVPKYLSAAIFGDAATLSVEATKKRNEAEAELARLKALGERDEDEGSKTDSTKGGPKGGGGPTSEKG